MESGVVIVVLLAVVFFLVLYIENTKPTKPKDNSNWKDWR